VRVPRNHLSFDIAENFDLRYALHRLLKSKAVPNGLPEALHAYEILGDTSDIDDHERCVAFCERISEVEEEFGMVIWVDSEGDLRVSRKVKDCEPRPDE